MRRIAILLVLAIGLWLTGCGSNNNSVAKNPGSNPPPGGTGQQPPPPTPAPPPTPTPPPTPGAAQFSETMLSNDATGAVDGMVTVDSNGNGTMKLTAGGTANTTYTVVFCPFATGGCNNLTTFTADSNGTGSATFTVGHGGFSGNFELATTTDVPFISAINIPANGSSLQAALVRASTVSAGFPNMTDVGYGVGNDPLTSGSVTYTSGSSVNLQVAGAAASQAYDVTFCYNGGGSSCFGLGQLTTDATGASSATIDLSATVGAGNVQSGVFFLSTGKPPVIQFVSGFTAP